MKSMIIVAAVLALMVAVGVGSAFVAYKKGDAHGMRMARLKEVNEKYGNNKTELSADNNMVKRMDNYTQAIVREQSKIFTGDPINKLVDTEKKSS